MSGLYKLGSEPRPNFITQIGIMPGKIIVLLFFAFSVSTVNAQSYSDKDFKPLYSLQGLWKMETGRGPIYEEWNKKDDQKLTGRSYRINNTDTVVMERIELYISGNEIVYSPTVSNQNNQQPVSFKLISNAGGRFVFENKEHDFPQRIIYNLVSNDAVHARIEGVRNGQERGSDFRYSRVK
jgi:hypothetical protein